MRKVLFSTLLVALFGASSAFALSASELFQMGYPYLNPTQHYANYMGCLNTAKNGTEHQQIIANEFCQSMYGVTTYNPR